MVRVERRQRHLSFRDCDAAAAGDSRKFTYFFGLGDEDPIYTGIGPF